MTWEIEIFTPVMETEALEYNGSPVSSSSSFLPNLTWTPPGADGPVLDVATAVIDAMGDVDNLAPNEVRTSSI